MRRDFQAAWMGALVLSLAATALAESRPAGPARPSPAELLQYSDRARGASPEGLAWTAELETVEEGDTSRITYEVKVRGSDALAEAIAPPRDKGAMTLFNDRNLWFFKPGLRKPVSISARQKLAGQAANGDIASTNYARDYEGRILGEETVGGERAWKLELKARATNVTYDRILYWISQGARVGIKAEFYTVSGQAFKRAEFEYKNRLVAAGKEYPFVSRMIITDAANPGNRTILTYRKPRIEAVAASVFNVNNLVR